MDQHAQTWAQFFGYYLTFITPAHHRPKQTVSRGTQTVLIGKPRPSQVYQSGSTWTQTPPGGLESPGKTKRSPPPPKEAKSLNLSSVQNSRINKRWSGKPKRVTTCKGLRNPGTTCYRNSVIQCLFNMPEFVSYLDGLHNAKKCSEGKAGRCVACALKALLASYTDENVSKIPNSKTHALEQAMKLSIDESLAFAEFISNDRQGDPYEFLEYLLGELRQCESNADNVTADDLFKMATKMEWTCDECGNTLTTDDGTRADSGGAVGLTLDIQNPDKELPMLSYMRKNVYSEKLTIRCESEQCIEKYGEKFEGFRRTRVKLITKAPEIVVIRLNRFAWGVDEETNAEGPIKIDDQVDFEEYINLGDFTESGVPIIYQLQGVVAHGGKRLVPGHYIAAVREPNGKTFCSINDQINIGTERNGEVHELQFPKNMHSSFDPFILFYSKI